MSNYFQIVAYILANCGLFMISSLLAGLSFFAYYRRPEQTSYFLTGLGLAVVGLPGLLELLYTFYIDPGFIFTSAEFLVLQATEDILIATGLGLLLFAITKHRPGLSEHGHNDTLVEEQEYWKLGKPFDD